MGDIRGMEHSILHDRLSKAGACFENPPDGKTELVCLQNQEAKYGYDFNKQTGLKITRLNTLLCEQQSACSNKPPLVNFSKGKTRKSLNRIATANLDVEIGRVVYTQFLNKKAG